VNKSPVRKDRALFFEQRRPDLLALMLAGAQPSRILVDVSRGSHVARRVDRLGGKTPAARQNARAARDKDGCGEARPLRRIRLSTGRQEMLPGQETENVLRVLTQCLCWAMGPSSILESGGFPNHPPLLAISH